MCNSTGEERFENGTASIASIEQVRMEDLHDAMEIKAKSSDIIRQSSLVSQSLLDPTSRIFFVRKCIRIHRTEFRISSY
jgi:hypothetical protein